MFLNAPKIAKILNKINSPPSSAQTVFCFSRILAIFFTKTFNARLLFHLKLICKYN